MVNGKLVMHVNYDPSSGADYPMARLIVCPTAVSANGYTLSATVRFNYNLTTGLDNPNAVWLFGSNGRPQEVFRITDPAGYTPDPYVLTGQYGFETVYMIGLNFEIKQYFSGDILIDDVKLLPP
jgi:hypothetical protein